MSFELVILGSSSSTPTRSRHPSAQLLKINTEMILIDCGEGTQNQLLRYKINHNKIGHIFISHMHGDHWLGLPGLLATMNVQGRKLPLDIYCPEELEFLINLQFKLSDTEINFEINYHKIKAEVSEIIMKTMDFHVYNLPLQHRVPTNGFLFKEKSYGRKINKQECDKLGIEVESYADLRAGKDFVTSDGKTIPNKKLTFDPRKSFNFAYISDTIYDEALVEHIKGFDLLYHEATFLHDLFLRAKETFHSTALQAAKIASRAKVKQLVIGHFSARYTDLQGHLDEAKDVFENTFLAIEGEKFRLR